MIRWLGSEKDSLKVEKDKEREWGRDSRLFEGPWARVPLIIILSTRDPRLENQVWGLTGRSWPASDRFTASTWKFFDSPKRTASLVIHPQHLTFYPPPPPPPPQYNTVCSNTRPRAAPLKMFCVSILDFLEFQWGGSLGRWRTRGWRRCDIARLRMKLFTSRSINRFILGKRSCWSGWVRLGKAREVDRSRSRGVGLWWAKGGPTIKY